MPDDKEQASPGRAYAIWEREGRPDGKDLDHWLRAEAEVISATQRARQPVPHCEGLNDP